MTAPTHDADRALSLASPPRRRLGLTMGALALSPLTGCGALSPTDPPLQFFVFDDQKAAMAAPPVTPIARTLIVTSGPGPALYASQRMVFTRDGVGHAYYQYAHWSERPVRRMVTLAARRLATQSGLQAVSVAESGVRADLLLTLRLDALVHDDASAPGHMRLHTDAELLDWPAHQLLARRRFTLSAPLAERHARAAAQATSVVVTTWLDELTTWLQATLTTSAS